jgi:hypothetical protein
MRRILRPCPGRVRGVSRAEERGQARSASSSRDVSPHAPSTSRVPVLRSNRGSTRPTSRSPTRIGSTWYPVGDRAVRRLGMGAPLAALESHAERAEALVGEQPVRLAHRHGLRGRIPTIGEIPEALTVPPPHDRDRAARVQDVEHLGYVAAPGPAARVRRAGRPVVELAREHGPAPVELAQHVAAEAGVRAQPLGAAPLLRVAAGRLRPHHRADQRQILDRPDVRRPLEEHPLRPEHSVELGGVEGPEPAPGHELLGRRDGRDRVELEEAQAAHGLAHAARRSGEELRAHGDPARLVASDGVRGARQRSSPSPARWAPSAASRSSHSAPTRSIQPAASASGAGVSR